MRGGGVRGGVQAYQHLYLGLLYGLLSVKSVLVDDFQALASGSIGSLHLKRLSSGVHPAPDPLVNSTLSDLWPSLARARLCSHHT